MRKLNYRAGIAGTDASERCRHWQLKNVPNVASPMANYDSKRDLVVFPVGHGVSARYLARYSLRSSRASRLLPHYRERSFYRQSGSWKPGRIHGLSYDGRRCSGAPLKALMQYVALVL
jgi:hypothetical protein